MEPQQYRRKKTRVAPKPRGFWNTAWDIYVSVIYVCAGIGIYTLLVTNGVMPPLVPGERILPEQVLEEAMAAVPPDPTRKGKK